MTIREVIDTWLAWRRRRELERRIPGYREINDMIRKAQKGHRPVQHLMDKRRELLQRYQEGSA